MEQELLDYYHNTGKMPDWVYYQLSDKPCFLKFQEQREKIYRNFSEKQKMKEQEKKLMENINKQVEDEAKKAFSKLIKSFSKH